MTIEDAIAAVRNIKDLGTSSKAMLPINVLLPALEDARRWREAPQVFKDAVKGAGQ
jgi:hypothetical protein